MFRSVIDYHRTACQDLSLSASAPYTSPSPSYYPGHTSPSPSLYPSHTSHTTLETVDCPICGLTFHQDIIERHAATCGE